MQLNKVEIFGNLFGHWFKKKKKKQLHISVWGWRLRWAQLPPRTARHVARARRSQSCTQHGTVKGRGGRRCWRRRLATELLTFSQMEVWVSCATEYGVAGIHGRLAFSGATSRVAGVVGPNLLLVGVVDWDHTLAWCVCVCFTDRDVLFFYSRSKNWMFREDQWRSGWHLHKSIWNEKVLFFLRLHAHCILHF